MKCSARRAYAEAIAPSRTETCQAWIHVLFASSGLVAWFLGELRYRYPTFLCAVFSANVYFLISSAVRSTRHETRVSRLSIVSDDVVQLARKDSYSAGEDPWVPFAFLFLQALCLYWEGMNAAFFFTDIVLCAAAGYLGENCADKIWSSILLEE